MSLESGRNIGLISSLLNIVMPVIVIVGVIAFVISAIVSATLRITPGTVAPLFGFSIGFFVFIVAIAATGIIGFILFMVAMYQLSNYYHEPGIFKNVLYAFILNILSLVVILFIEFASIISSIAGISQVNAPSSVFPFLTLIAVLAAALVFAIVNGLFYMRAFNKLKEKSGVDNFGTAGILYLIGAIIPLVVWIAWIFAALGFQKLRQFATPPVPYLTPPLPNTIQTKHCPNCGTENRADALYCTYCGKPLQ